MLAKGEKKKGERGLGPNRGTSSRSPYPNVANTPVRGTSASSRHFLGNSKMSFVRTVKVSTNPLGQLASREQLIGFNNGALAMHPFGFDGIEPGTLRREQKGQDADAFALVLDLLVMLAYPGAHDQALMPGGIVPDQQPGSFSLCLQLTTTPVQKLGGDIADRTTGDKAQRHLVANRIIWRALLPQDSITGQGFGIRIPFVPGVFDQAYWLILTRPRLQARQRKATPPDFVEKANSPLSLHTGPSNQAVPGDFFSVYWGSGLVIQCLARFQLIFNRKSVWRMVSALTWMLVQPSSTHTSATNSKVHRPVGLPKSRGLRCKSALNVSASTSARAVRKRCGRREPACSASGPFWLKAWMALRTVCSSQLRALAMLGTRSPRAEASRIWLRRMTKASEERSPASICWRSSSVRGWMNMGCLMLTSLPHSQSSFLSLH